MIMRKLEYRKARGLLDTLQEAGEILAGMHDQKAKMALIADMRVFIERIAEYLNSIAETSCWAEALNGLKKDLVCGDAEAIPIVIGNIRESLDTAKIEYTDPGKFTAETDFSRYIELLYQASMDGYSILITSMDTPCGSSRFSEKLGEKLQSLGLAVNLCNKWRASYCAVIDEGQRVDEKISETHSVSISCCLGGTDIFIKSAGMQKADASRQCSVKINGVEKAVRRRGLSFVIYDKESKKVIDSVNFDTYSDNLTALRPGILPALKEFMDSASGVVFIDPCYPAFPKENLSKNEKRILNERIHYSRFYENPMLPSPIQKHIGEPSGILEVLRPPISYVGLDGARHFEDQEGKYFNILNGHRRTVGQPDHFKRTVYVVGGCMMLGIGVRDEGTLASKLQGLLNRCVPEEGFLVENYGFALDGMDQQAEILAILRSLPLKAGDIVVGVGDKIISYNPKLDIRPYRYGEIFFDDIHVTEEAHELVAEGLLETFQKNDFFKSCFTVQKPLPQTDFGNYRLSETQLSELKEYKKKLERIYVNCAQSNDFIGAIVMNCNPFTLGHRYLIEECSKRCDRLFVFVVQEDKSYFPFADRFLLVKEGCRDLKNVSVLESGKFILSSLTFSEYFNKSRLQDRIVDSSEDVLLFAREIAPTAHIQVRFVGTEPLDAVTNQYNRTMAAILTRYGIRFEEIPRLEKEGEVISASRVRKLLEGKEWEAIHKLVPETTYVYLWDKYHVE